MRLEKLVVPVAVVVFLVLGTLVWFAARRADYAIKYQAMVEETIRENVKPECLVGDRD